MTGTQNSSTNHPFWTVAVIVALVFVGLGLYAFQPWRLFTTNRVDEAAPVVAKQLEVAPQQLAAGSFISHEHKTTGSAEVQRLPDGSLTLRLTELKTSDGPALRVWLSDQPVKQDDWNSLDDGEHVDLGALKGNEGNQNYAVPAGTDLGKYRTVTIWCDRFNVSFGAAELERG